MNIKDFLKILESAKRWDHTINYQENPFLYTYTDDCKGMYTCNPYKEELLQLWKFLKKDSASQTAKDLYSYFLKMLEKKDFVGADLARKYILAGSKKKLLSSRHREVFENFYFKAKTNENYISLRDEFIKKQKEIKDSKNK